MSQLETIKASVFSRLKTWIGAGAGLLSGAVMMYVSPLIDKVVRPSKPVANFAVEQQSLTVVFHNRSAGASDGWWDFGDGSPLEPLSSKQPSFQHTYARPGSYNVKLSIRSLLGEENERTIPLQLGGDASKPPEILALRAMSISQGDYAPATFRVESKTNNADLCVWNYDDERPLDITDAESSKERYVTFTKPGGYVIKLAAVNGKQAKERSTVVNVNEPPPGVTAILSVTDSATKVEKLDNSATIPVQYPPQSKSDAEPFEKQIPARAGFEIMDAKLQPYLEKYARDLRIQIADDKQSAKLSGTLVRESGWFKGSGSMPTVFLQAILTQERRLPVSRPALLVSMTLEKMPDKGFINMPPVPGDWIGAERALKFELHDGERIVWQGTSLPRNVKISLQNRTCGLSALQVGDQVRVDLTEIKPGATPAAN